MTSIEVRKTLTMNTSEEITIAPSSGLAPLQLSELWRHRDLLRYLAQREIYMTYANTAIGMFWVLLQPLATALVLTVVLGVLVRVPTGGESYALIVLSAFPFWIFFNNVVVRSANSMKANAHLLTKVYFPRVIIVLVPLISGLLDLAVLLVVLFIAAPFFGKFPTFSWLFLIVPLVLTVLLALGAGLWFSLLTVHVPDVGHALPVILQIGLYLTPVLYPIGLVPVAWRWLYDLNPLVGIVDSARWALLGTGEFPAYALTASAIISLTVLVGGIYFFRILEDATTDVI